MRRIQHVIAAIAIALVAACATTPLSVNFSGASAENISLMAISAVRQIEVVSPPAKTTLAILMAKEDAFGAELVAALRSSGYAVVEQADRVSVTSDNSATPLRYSLDSAEPFYRLQLFLGKSTLTRAFQVSEDGTVTPAGVWAKVEATDG